MRHPFHRTALLAPGALAVIGLLAACTTPAPSQTEAEADVCTQTAAVVTALEGVAALGADSTVVDAQAAREGLRDAVAALKASAQDLQAADAQALDAGLTAIADAIDNISGSDTLGAAAAGVKASAGALEGAVQQINDGFECG